MTRPPDYFESIRARAARRWDQLEEDPELAAPWHQLFMQVQSPRHVLSELLQNADDAGATEASAQVHDGCFIFEHNGQDFTDDHFASLCRFGYSSKRALHTIGFRGVGFKSTFSLGNSVELFTPTLSVSFDRRRFTEPKWQLLRRSKNGGTQVRVTLADERRQLELEANFEEWLRSPVSLLFFRHIRSLSVGGQEIRWIRRGPGPVPRTRWMAVEGTTSTPYLVARSSAESFPPDAIAEISEERLLGSADQAITLPPCIVELVLGAEGRLYVVLPTEVDTALPFACNAPFIQDPARLKIKDPETSPTNRWLLERLGRLAASTMLQWLNRSALEVADRSRSYHLLPDVDRADSSIGGRCAAIIEETVAAEIRDRPILLTNTGGLKPAGQSVIIPDALHDVWSVAEIDALLEDGDGRAFSRYVLERDCEKLVRWGLIDPIDTDLILARLQRKHLPRPRSWRRLQKLWAFLAPTITGYRAHPKAQNICIVPVQGKDELYAANEVVRLGERRVLQSEADWKFLSAHLLVLNQNWPRFLAEQRRLAEAGADDAAGEDAGAAAAVLHALGLAETSDVSTVISRVTAEFFAGGSIPLRDCVRLAQIGAKLGAKTDGAFRFVTRDGRLRFTGEAVVFDQAGTLDDLMPDSWCASHLTHRAYSASYDSCTPEEWAKWVSSGHSGLLGFANLTLLRSSMWGRDKAQGELRRRGFTGDVYYPYVRGKFVLEDWDFEASLWTYWVKLASEDPTLWARLVERIIAEPESFLSKAKMARVLQVATTGTTRSIVHEPLLPSWILKLRDLPCLPDTRGFPHKPGDLLRRTAATESLIDVEPFVHTSLDTEATRPLLKLLGVRDTPTGPDRLLDCMRTLAQADMPPLHEVDKWYRRLDQMVDTCSTLAFDKIARTFRTERLILATDGNWNASSGVFLSVVEEDAPGAPAIRDSVKNLTLWRKIGVAERPTADLAIKWLKELPTGRRLSAADVRRARALQGRHPVRIWSEAGHWLNLAGEWAPTTALAYALTMHSLIPWIHLHEWVKQKTADFQGLTSEITDTPPFSDLPLLASCIEDRFHGHLRAASPVPSMWLRCLGTALGRIELDDSAETTRLRATAGRLGETSWETVPVLEVTPYIDGKPAGTARRAEVVWREQTLCVVDRPLARLARAVAQELGRHFGRQDIAEAIKLCFDRPAEFITEYVEENFRVSPREADASSVAAAATAGAETADRPSELKEREDSEATEVQTAPAVNALADVEGEHEAENEVLVDQSGADGFGGRVKPDRLRGQPNKPTIIERFARTYGFRKVAENRFLHADGTSLIRVTDDVFPWEKRSVAGDTVRRYWAKDHCVEREPLQLDAEIWGLLEGFPEICCLILTSPHGDAVEVSGARLRMMRKAGQVTLYPATYRLVYRDGHTP